MRQAQGAHPGETVPRTWCSSTCSYSDGWAGAVLWLQSKARAESRPQAVLGEETQARHSTHMDGSHCLGSPPSPHPERPCKDLLWVPMSARQGHSGLPWCLEAGEGSY